MPRNLEELAQMIANRDNISYNEAMKSIHECELDMEAAFYNGNLDLAEEILRSDLGLELDYFDLFIS